MRLEKKEQTVAEIAGNFARSPLAVLTDYRGLTVAEITQLRGVLRRSGVQYRVSKNTLTRFAAEKMGVKELESLLTGPTAIAYSGADPVALAKAISEYARSSKILRIKGGVFGGKVIGVKDIDTLAALPSREVLLARALGAMQAPVVGIVSVLSGTLASFVHVVDARRRQLEAAS